MRLAEVKNDFIILPQVAILNPAATNKYMILINIEMLSYRS